MAGGSSKTAFPTFSTRSIHHATIWPPQARISAAGGLQTIFKTVIKVSCFITVEGCVAIASKEYLWSKKIGLMDGR
jgi:hypothetical protein